MRRRREGLPPRLDHRSVAQSADRESFRPARLRTQAARLECAPGTTGEGTLSTVTSRGSIAGLASLLACALAGAPAHAQSYPNKPVTIVVTAAAGGLTDVVARAIGQRLGELWGQQI